MGVCKYARFSCWISAISRLSASTRCRIPPSMQQHYIYDSFGNPTDRLLNNPRWLFDGSLRQGSFYCPYFQIGLCIVLTLSLRPFCLCGRDTPATTSLSLSECSWMASLSCGSILLVTSSFCEAKTWIQSSRIFSSRSRSGQGKSCLSCRILPDGSIPYIPWEDFACCVQ
jgi:hypothetical protein